MNLEALFFGAHPDDIELTSAGLAARLAGRGHACGLVDLTAGEMGTRGDPPTRAREARAAADLLGIAVRVGLGLPDGGLDRHDRSQLRTVVECLREHRPSLVVAPWFDDAHPDHVEAAHLVTRACHLAGLARWPATGERHRPRRLLYALYRTTSAPHLVVDVGDVRERRLSALRAHASQLDPAAGAPTYLTQPAFLAEVEGRARAFGGLIGVDFGEGYRSRGPLAITDARALLPGGEVST